jgi:hypothetical protein
VSESVERGVMERAETGSDGERREE